MNRRDFFRYLISSGALIIADPEKLLWIPGEKVYFLPTVNPIFIPTYDNEILKRIIRDSYRQLQCDIDIALYQCTPTIHMNLQEYSQYRKLAIRKPGIWK